MELKAYEKVEDHPILPGVYDLTYSFGLTDKVFKALQQLEDRREVDVVLVPLSVLQAVKDSGYPIGKARVIRPISLFAEEISINKFGK